MKKLALEKAYEWVDKNPTKDLEFYCEEGNTATNDAGLRIIKILNEDCKTEDELVQDIAKVQWYKKYTDNV